MLPERVGGVVESRGRQREERIETFRHPAYPERVARVLTMVVHAASAMPLPIGMPWARKTGERRRWALGKGVPRTLWETARLPWFWWDGRQRGTGGDQIENPTIFPQQTRRGGLGGGGFRGFSQPSVSHIPHRRFGMGEIHDLHRPWNVFGRPLPDPGCAVASHDSPLGLLSPPRHRHVGEQPVKATFGGTACYSAHAAWRWRLHILEDTAGESPKMCRESKREVQ